MLFTTKIYWYFTKDASKNARDEAAVYDDNQKPLWNLIGSSFDIVEKKSI